MAKDKNPVGRPLKFKTEKELSEKIEEYFKKCDENKSTIYSKKIDGLLEIPNPIPPTVEGLALHLETSRKTILEYEKKDQFSNTIKRAKLRILDAMTRSALRGDYNPAVSIFLMKANWGMQDKQVIDYGKDSLNAFEKMVLDRRKARNVD